MAAQIAAHCASRSRETSTPRAVRTLQSLSLAVLADDHAERPVSSATPGAAGGVSCSRETSTPCAVRALQSLSPAVLAEGSAAWPHCMPAAARRDRAR